MAANNTTKKQQESAAEAIRKTQDDERIEYTALRPIGTDPKETDVTVTVNGKNYRVQYDKKVKIPRFVAEVLDRTYRESRNVYDKVSNLAQSKMIAEY